MIEHHQESQRTLHHKSNTANTANTANTQVIEQARNVEEKEGKGKYISESTDNFDQNDETIVDTAEQASKAMIVPDEVCNDEEYEKANSSNEEKSICSVDIYPLKYNLDGLESFRS